MLGFGKFTRRSFALIRHGLFAIFLFIPCASSLAVSEAGPGKKIVYSHPAIDSAEELKGRALVEAIRAGGYVLYVRHTEAGVITSDCTKNNLTPAGEEDARQLGDALRDLRIPIGKVLSSQVCRVQDTARLLNAGPVVVTADLTNIELREGHDFHAGRMRRLAETPDAGKNTLLIGHMQGGNTFDQALHLDYGEMIVFRPDGKGRSAPIGRIRLDDWPDLVIAVRRQN